MNMARMVLVVILSLLSLNTFANCCQRMGGIGWCDSSAGRLICRNGEFSTCYCNRHAVMDLQRLSGCCQWQGGVMATSPSGAVVCNNGSISEICTLAHPKESTATW